MTKNQNQILLLPGNCVYYWGKKRRKSKYMHRQTPPRENIFSVNFSYRCPVSNQCEIFSWTFKIIHPVFKQELNLFLRHLTKILQSSEKSIVYTYFWLGRLRKRVWMFWITQLEFNSVIFYLFFREVVTFLCIITKQWTV